MSAGEGGGGGAPPELPLPLGAAPLDAFTAVVRGVRAKNEWWRLPREFSRAELTPASLGELLDIDDDDAADLFTQLRGHGVKTVGALLTASVDISKDPTSGDYSAKGRLARVRVPGALDQIAALRSKIRSASDAAAASAAAALLGAQQLKDIAEALCGPRLAAPPTIDELRARLKREVPAALPVSTRDLAAAATACEVQLGAGRTHEFLVAADPCIASSQFPALGYIIADRGDRVRGVSQTEDMVHGFLRPLLKDPLLTLIGWLEPEWLGRTNVTRNAEEPRNKRSRTTVDGMRPDWQFHQRLLVFRGEEKRDGGSLDEARKELLSKFETWSPVLFGDAPYVLAYACAGVALQLYVIHRVGPPAQPQAALFELGDRLLLSRGPDRFRLVRYIIHLVRVIEAIVDALPQDLDLGIGLYERAESGGNSEITFRHDCVRKVLKDDAVVRHDFVALRELYQLVAARRIVRTVGCLPGYPVTEIARGLERMVLHLAPVGHPRRPRNCAELRRALADVLAALQSMHASGFVHRDVRWPNVVLLLDETWMLIDLDFAARLENGAAPWPVWTRGVPDRPSPDARWSPAQDVAQTARLVLELDVDWLSTEQRLVAHRALAACTSATDALQALGGADAAAALA